ncbi:hypothetical protein FXN58_07295 [Aggregatibacter actinomycetemcomitans]|nr:hypothetical protein FXN58_07295 [Aggregatibacter actinomycetemcomitans]QEH49682.1 hypothetical protein FXN57_08710 [Aggregatibacter actinomycetemcomitans]
MAVEGIESEYVVFRIGHFMLQQKKACRIHRTFHRYFNFTILFIFTIHFISNQLAIGNSTNLIVLKFTTRKLRGS